MAVIKVETPCDTCHGTGIFKAYHRPAGYGFICSNCKGNGKVDLEFTYTPFIGRVHLDDIQRVGYSQSLPGNPRATCNDPMKEGIPYEEWFAGKEPPPRPQ